MRQVLQSKPLVNVLSWRQKSPKNRLKQKIRFLRNCTPQATKNLGFQPLQYPTKKIETEGNFYHVRPNFGFGGTVSQQLSKIFLFCKKILVPYEQGYRICSNKQRVHPQKMKFLCFNMLQPQFRWFQNGLICLFNSKQLSRYDMTKLTLSRALS